MKRTFYLAAAGLVAALCPGNQLCGQSVDDNRTLTGSADLGDVGRYVGPLKLGQIEITSNNFVAPPAADPTVPAPPAVQHSINIAQDGFAWLGNGLLIRNGSGQDLVFDGQNPNAQSHNLDVFYFGNGSGPIGRNGVPTALGSFDIQDFSFGSSTTNQYQNNDENVTTTFGGHWFQQGVFRDDSGDITVIEQLPSEVNSPGSNLGTSPVTLERGRSIENNSSFNRVDSSQPAPLNDSIRNLFSPPLRLVEAESQVAERRNPLFAVEPSAPENAGTLDLSGIEISVSGTSVADRRLTGGTVNLGRRLVGGDNEAIVRNDIVQISTAGSDDVATRLNVSSFNLAENGTTANLASSTAFTDAADSARVSISADFTIDGNETGTFFKGVDAGASISSLENLSGETVQDNLGIGYQYSVVDENEAESSSITAYRIDNFDTSGQTGFNDSVDAVYSTNAHTDIQVAQGFVLDGNSVQTVTLSKDNGITGEGLDGEQVTATTSYDIHTRSVQSSDLQTTPEGNVGESPILIENNREVSSQLQATAYLTRATRNGSDRWFFDPDNSLDLQAGESITLTPQFDDTGLVQNELALGRNFRTTVSLSYQDGFRPTDEDAVLGTENLSTSSRFDVFGSDTTAQTLSWVLERELEVTATAGTIDLDGGISLRNEGINLTNTSDNSTQDFLTTVRLLDGIVPTSDEGSTALALAFQRLDEVSEELSSAEGFDALSSDVVNLTGLDGNLHTIEISYNADFEGDPASADLLWFDTGDLEILDDGAWVNAVLGNSNIVNYDLDADLIELLGQENTSSLSDYLASLQFASSYTDYLFGLESDGPQLGAHGFDIDTGVAWAVIDHNSAFSTSVTAVPEPASATILSVLVIGAFTRRRRVG